MQLRAALVLLGWLAACGDEGRLGRECRSDAECDGLRCAASSLAASDDLAPIELRCAAPGSHGEPGEACERPNDCANGLCLLAGACATACEEDGDCAEGASCESVYSRSVGASLATLHACVRVVDLPRDAVVEREVRPGALVRGDNVIDLPPLAADAALYVLEHLDDDTWPVPDPQSLCRPPLCARRLLTREQEPQLLFDLDSLDDATGPDEAVASGSHVNPLTLLIPNGPRAPLVEAGYSLEVEAKHEGALRLTTLSRSERGQRLDLNLFYVGAAGLRSEGDRGVPLMAAALAEVDRIFGQADIYLGEVRQIEVAGELLERGTPLPDAAASAGFAQLRSQYQVLPQLPKLFELSAGAANCALDVFFVAGIDARGGGDVGGIAGGTPVAAGMHGTPGSGVVIAADVYVAAEQSQALGRTLAHELAHALGLFHTTEVDGRVFDPLPDTPSCPIARDTNRDGALDAGECAAFGGDNLMFPTTDATDTRLTPEQIEVLQRALILQ